MTFAQKPKPTQPITKDVKILCPACHGTGYPCKGEPNKYIAPSCCKGKGYIWATLYKEQLLDVITTNGSENNG